MSHEVHERMVAALSALRTEVPLAVADDVSKKVMARVVELEKALTALLRATSALEQSIIDAGATEARSR